MKKLVLTGGFAAVFALGQTDSDESTLLGQVESIDECGTSITLASGMTLFAPAGAKVRPGAVDQGMLVVATYRVADDGRKVLTRLSRG